VRTLKQQQLFANFQIEGLHVPARELFAFTVPLLTSDLVYVLMSSSDALLLGHFRTTAEVGTFRVVQPAAILNLFVLQSFTLLFTPIAARLFARNDREGINNLYWQTAIWTSILSFPIFALTFSLAHPITVVLYGQEWAESAVILALLSVGYYFNAALGFNGLTLRVFGLVRYTVLISVGAAVANVAINLLLIPRFGAIGAGVGTCATLVLHNVLKQAGLRKGTGISILDREHVRVYGAIVAVSALLVTIHAVVGPAPATAIALVGIGSAAVLWVTRDTLHVGDTFPELRRVPLLRRVVG